MIARYEQQVAEHTARRDLEAFFGIKVFLESTVEVRRHWRRDERALHEFGFRLTS